MRKKERDCHFFFIQSVSRGKEKKTRYGGNTREREGERGERGWRKKNNTKKWSRVFFPNGMDITNHNTHTHTQKMVSRDLPRRPTPMPPRKKSPSPEKKKRKKPKKKKSPTPSSPPRNRITQLPPRFGANFNMYVDSPFRTPPTRSPLNRRSRR